MAIAIREAGEAIAITITFAIAISEAIFKRSPEISKYPLSYS